MLWYRQDPPVIRADQPGGLSFDIFIAGDVEQVVIERYSAEADVDVAERWPRANQRTLDGRVVSVFEPTWSRVELWDTLAWSRRGYDSPGGFFGRLRVQERSVSLHVRISPVNLPPSAIERVDESVQYASHVVNIAVPEPRFSSDQDIIREFYGHFVDEYESIAIVWPGYGFDGASAYHGTVRNPIAGLGMEVFDGSADYGSQGKLRGYEGYYDLTFTSMGVSNHELGHTWADFWDWSAITGLDLGMCFDGIHYPPLFPGTRYVASPCFGPLSSIAEVGDGRFEVVGSAMPVTFSPATLYRMGLVEPDAVGEMVVFSYTGEQPWIPRGHIFDGGYARVHINDVMARHGERSGPVDSSWRRAAIVVSRGELLSSEEMSYWNFFAARHSAEDGVRTFRGATSFYEATGGLARLHTDVTPKTGMKLVSDLGVSDVPVDAREFPGVRLDEPIPARFTVGDRITLAGTVAEPGTSYDRLCLTAVSSSAYFGLPGHRRHMETCGAIVGGRFEVSEEFTDNGSGVADQYALSIHLVPPGATSLPPPVSSVSGITVVPGDGTGGTNQPPTTTETLPDVRLEPAGALEVDVSQAFTDPDGDALTYTVSSSAPRVVTVLAAGGRVTLTAVAEGTATIRVTATDPGSLTATQTFTVVVGAARPFTDEVIRPGVTPVRAVHFTELRTRIDGVRSAAGLGRFAWTDPVLTARVTPVRLVHILELRSALSAAYMAAGRPPPRWTDAAPAGGTPIRAAHLMELRAAVVALE